MTQLRKKMLEELRRRNADTTDSPSPDKLLLQPLATAEFARAQACQVAGENTPLNRGRCERRFLRYDGCISRPSICRPSPIRSMRCNDKAFRSTSGD